MQAEIHTHTLRAQIIFILIAFNTLLQVEGATITEEETVSRWEIYEKEKLARYRAESMTKAKVAGLHKAEETDTRLHYLWLEDAIMGGPAGQVMAETFLKKVIARISDPNASNRLFLIENFFRFFVECKGIDTFIGSSSEDQNLHQSIVDLARTLATTQGGYQPESLSYYVNILGKISEGDSFKKTDLHLALLRELAVLGCAKAQYDFGCLLARDRKNHGLAVDWFEKAAAQGHKEALMEIRWKQFTEKYGGYHYNSISEATILYVGEKEIPDEDFVSIQGIYFPKLVTVSFIATKLGTEGAKFLAAPNVFPALTRLEIINTILGNEENQILAESVFATVTTLDLTNTRFTAHNASPFLTARVFPALTKLCLRWEVRKRVGIAQQFLSMGSMGAGTFAHLAELDIAGNELNDEENEHNDANIENIASIFPALTTLCLHNTGINGEGMRHLARPGAFPALVSLDLSDNDLGDKDIRNLAIPGAFPTLVSLDLKNNLYISERGLPYLSKAGAFPVLEVLDILHTHFTNKYRHLVPAITKNRDEVIGLFSIVPRLEDLGP